MARAKKESNEKQWSGMPINNEAEMKEIKAAVASTYDIFQSIENSKAELKELFDDINARTGIPKRIFNFLCKANYAGNGYETIQSNNELEDAYNAFEGVPIDE